MVGSMVGFGSGAGFKVVKTPTTQKASDKSCTRTGPKTKPAGSRTSNKPSAKPKPAQTARSGLAKTSSARPSTTAKVGTVATKESAHHHVTVKEAVATGTVLDPSAMAKSEATSEPAVSSALATLDPPANVSLTAPIEAPSQVVGRVKVRYNHYCSDFEVIDGKLDWRLIDDAYCISFGTNAACPSSWPLSGS